MREGILKGLYRYRASGKERREAAAQLLGSGTIMFEVLKAQEILEKNYGVAADVWSVTSYKELYREANDCERWNMLHPTRTAKVPYVTQTLQERVRPVHRGVGLHEGAAGEHCPVGSRANWCRWARMVSDAARIARPCGTSSKWTRSTSCWRRCTRWRAKSRWGRDVLEKAIRDLGINPEKSNPAMS